jgi:hypothetical protein
VVVPPGLYASVIRTVGLAEIPMVPQAVNPDVSVAGSLHWGKALPPPRLKSLAPKVPEPFRPAPTRFAPLGSDFPRR